MDEEYRKALVKVRLERAEELLAEAEDLLEKHFYKSANNRAFYSMEKSVKALLASIGTDVSTHSGALKQFNYYFIYKGDGTFTRDDYLLLSGAEQIRSNSDYDDFYIASREEAVQQIKDAEGFLKKVSGYLNTK